jgi:hypothetical protein
MHAALDRADGDRIGHEESLKPGLDREQSGKLTQHRHKLSKRRANGAVPPFSC